MIITKTPFRISFFGGATDIPEFFNENGGAVISTTINKFVYTTVRELPPFFDYKNEIKYSKIERTNDIDYIEHPMIRNAMKLMKVENLFISYDADLPGRTGLGTSSTFCVGLLNAFYSLKNIKTTKKELAVNSIKVERELCKEDGGWQDQIAAAYGGFNRIDFADNSFKVTPIKISEDRKAVLKSNLLLFFTGFTRFSADIQKNTKKQLIKKREYMCEMLQLVDEAQKILEDNKTNIDDFGYLLGKTWELKKQLNSEISKSTIDNLYDSAIKAGALGGKLLGAGGGGFLLFYVPKIKQNQVKKALQQLMEVPFDFDNVGTTVLFKN